MQAMQPWTDTRLTLRGPDIWSRDTAGHLPDPRGVLAARAPDFPDWTPDAIETGAGLSGWYWAGVAVFFALLLGSLPIGQAITIALGTACLIGAGLFLDGWRRLAWLIAGLLVLSAPLLSAAQAQQAGIASVYSDKYHGRRAANGQTFNQGALTAAHRSLPFGTRVRVTNQANGKSVVVTITDRGPFVKGRVIDLSRAGQRAIGMPYGLARVRLEVLGRGG